MELAERTRIPQPSLALYEQTGHLSAERVDVIQAVLEAAGVDFSGKMAVVKSVSIRRISGQQCQEARHLLGWTQKQLADTAGTKIDQISRIEALRGGLRTQRVCRRVEQVRAVLKAAGVEFITDNKGMSGVRLRTHAK